MSAILGILNKHAVAIAADSAVTISGTNGRKIFNTANKVFALSKFHPIGVMLYNSAYFMSCPWETIIKIYRKRLGQTYFNTVKEYQEDFIKFLKSKNYYSNDSDQDLYMSLFAQNIVTIIINQLKKSHQDLLEEIEFLEEDPSVIAANKAKAIGLINSITTIYTEKMTLTPNNCEDFDDYDYNDFLESKAELIAPMINYVIIGDGSIFKEEDITQECKDKIMELIYICVKSKEFLGNFTGLVFTGFGEEEIYPSLIPVNISFALGERLRYYIDESNVTNITNENSATVRPFAQTDVIDTILSGIDPKLDQIYAENFSTYLSKYNDIILETIGDENPELSTLIRGLNINDIVNDYKKKNIETKRTNYIFPLINAVSSLSKEDLAEMAESLIYLTYLKRRITFAEESVGGPVDVAVISKGDGFIWIKRKHYFNPELNQTFFQNYLT